MKNPMIPKQNYWKLDWLRRSIITAISIALVLLAIPVVIQYSLPYLLTKQGAREASIQDINLNLFDGSFELSKLRAYTDNHRPLQIEHLYLDLAMRELLSGRILFDRLLIDGLDAAIQRNKNGDIVVNGLKIAVHNTSTSDTADTQTTTDSGPVPFGIRQLDITNTQLDYAESDLNQSLKLRSLQLSNIKSWDSESIAELEIDAQLEGAPTRLSAQLKLFETERQLNGSLSIQSMPFAPYAKFYRDSIESLQGKISLDVQFKVSLAEALSVKMSNKIKIEDLLADYRQINQRTGLISWQGDTQLTANGELTLTGNLNILDSRTSDTLQNYRIAEFSQLSIQGFQHEQQSIRFAQLDIENLQLIVKDEADKLLQLSKASIQGLELKLDSSQLEIERVAFSEPTVIATLNEQRQLVQLNPLLLTLQQLQGASENDDTATIEASSDQQALSIEVDRLELEQAGSVDFRDLSVSPHYHTRLTLNQIEIERLSSSNKARFLIALTQDAYTSIELSGEGLLFDPVENLQFKAQLKQLDLPPVTPYTSQLMGYGMRSGSINADIEVTLNKREIDSLIDLKIDSIEIVETNKDTAEQVSSASGMSIDLAISTLKDKNNLIQLKLPVTGNIDQPDFDLSLIINQAMGKAMKSATLSYLKHSLQPLGSLISLYSLAKTAAEHITLPPVLFASNSLEFKGDQQELLDKVIKVLNERPSLKIKACGISSLEDKKSIEASLVAAEISRLKKLSVPENKKEGDTPQIEEIAAESIPVDIKIVQQRMRQLADQRSAKIKAIFVEQGKLDSSRILNCLSASSDDEKSEGSVELLI